jgi:hypothetical protein
MVDAVKFTDLPVRSTPLVTNDILCMVDVNGNISDQVTAAVAGLAGLTNKEILVANSAGNISQVPGLSYDSGTGILTTNNQALFIGGAFETTNEVKFLGNFTTNITVTGNTSITLPTIGTLATTTDLGSYLLKSNNLSDVANVVTSRSNLGLGTMATANQSDYLALAGGTMTGNIQLAGDASLALQPVTLQQLNAVIAGLYPKQGCRLTTVANLTGTYANGASGVGATFTFTATGSQSVNGLATALNDRICMKNQTTQTQNGIYYVSTKGALGVQEVWTRATDYDTSAEVFSGTYTIISESGTDLAGTMWYLSTLGAVTIGVTNLAFSQANYFTQGTGISLVGNTIAANINTTNLRFNAGAIDLVTNPAFAGLTLTGFSGVVKASAGVLSASTITNSDLASGAFTNITGIAAFTGDVTTSAGSTVTTLATVNANVGSFGSSTAIPTFTANAKGQVTAVSTNAVVAPAGTLTGTTLAANVVTSSLTALGTLSSLLVTGTVAFGTTVQPGYEVTVLGKSLLNSNLTANSDRGLYLTCTASPLSSVSNIYLGYFLPVVNTAAGVVITNLYGHYLDAAIQVGLGSVTNAYTGFFLAPTTGTNKTALYSDNLSIGYTGITPPTLGAAISGNVGIGNSNPLLKAHVQGQSNGPSSSGNISKGGFLLQSAGTFAMSMGTFDSGSQYGWLQGHYTDNAGTLKPIVLNPLGGNAAINTTPVTSRALTVLADSTGDNVILTKSVAANAYHGFADLNTSDQTGLSVRIGSQGDAFLIQTGGTNTRLLITSAGNVVIGGSVSIANQLSLSSATIGPTTSALKFNSGMSTTSRGGGGVATALPSNPVGYLHFDIGGADYSVPYYTGGIY